MERTFFCPGCRGTAVSECSSPKADDEIFLSFYFAKGFDPHHHAKGQTNVGNCCLFGQGGVSYDMDKLSCCIPISHCLQLWVHNDARFNDDFNLDAPTSESDQLNRQLDLAMTSNDIQ